MSKKFSKRYFLENPHHSKLPQQEVFLALCSKTYKKKPAAEVSFATIQYSKFHSKAQTSPE